MPNKQEQEPIFAQDLENPIELSTKVTGRVWEWLKNPNLNSIWNSFKSTIELVTSGKEESETDGVIIKTPKKVKLEVDLEHGTITHKKENKNSKLSSRLRNQIQSLIKKFSSQSNNYTDFTRQSSTNNPKPTQPTHTANLINSLQSSRKDR